ncbi:hypothetical protein SBA4_3900005 [Candidatus Sulfopaludibacter sp. SbA4]|nr:hypothetical protein SBA4_3900005 [Candidatus Sulfopaludibacter sp. SbA4]
MLTRAAPIRAATVKGAVFPEYVTVFAKPIFPSSCAHETGPRPEIPLRQSD